MTLTRGFMSAGGLAALLPRLDDLRLDGAVVSPDAASLAVDWRAGTDELLDAAEAAPHRIAVWAVASAWAGAAAVSDLEAALDRGALGIKIDPFRQGHLLLDPVITPVLALADERGVPVYVATGTLVGFPLQLRHAALRWPAITFIAGRTGRCDYARDVPFLLRDCPNVYADTCHDGPDLWLPSILAAAGPGRVLFATDSPHADARHERSWVGELVAEKPELIPILGGNLLGIAAAAGRHRLGRRAKAEGDS